MARILAEVRHEWLTPQNCRAILQNQHQGYIMRGLEQLAFAQVKIGENRFREVNLLSREQGQLFFELVVASGTNAPSVGIAISALDYLAPKKLEIYLKLMKEKLLSFNDAQISEVNAFIINNASILRKISDEDFQRLFAYPEKLAALQRAMNIHKEEGLSKSHYLLHCLPRLMEKKLLSFNDAQISK